MGQSQRVLIIGAGSGGISLAARLERERLSLKMAIFDSQMMHYYQPYWTLVGAGLAQKDDFIGISRKTSFHSFIGKEC